tara:strand:- start:56 stop:514 length:459 start_codon:yes stop_codon:yes gene_type:complete
MNQENRIISNNKKAYYSYNISLTLLSGIQLHGAEIKSIRAGKVNISEAFCIISQNELWIKNMDIKKYQFCHNADYNPTRQRKLLLNKLEIKKIQKQLNEKGMTLIPTKILISEKGFAKVEIGLGKGKKLYDKRESLKKRDANIEIERKKREK